MKKPSAERDVIQLTNLFSDVDFLYLDIDSDGIKEKWHERYM